MRGSRAVLGLMAGLVCLYATAVHAEINNDGAQKLRALFEGMIREQEALAELKGKQDVVYDGEVDVEPAGTYYAVTLPHLSITYPDQTTLEIGMVSANAAPHDQPGQWKMTVAMPTPVILFDADHKQLMRVDIGGQQAVGIWDENLKYFGKLDAQYSDIRFNDSQSLFALTIPAIRTRYDLEKDGSGRWSGPAVFGADNITASFAGTGNTLALGKIESTIRLDRYDPAAMQNYRAQAIALAESRKNAEDKDGGPENALGMYAMISDALAGLGNGFTSQHSVSEIRITRPGAAAGSKKTLSLNKGHVGLDLGGMLEKEVSMALRFGFDGLTLVDGEQQLSDITPQKAALDIRISKLPLAQLSELGRNTLAGAAADPKLAQLAGLSLMFKLPALLTQAGTVIDINDNFVGNTLYNIALTGQIRADLSALNNFTGEMTLKIRGLDVLHDRAKALAADPGTDNAEKLAALAAMLEKIKPLARVEKEKGAEIHIVDLAMNAQGQFLANGQDAFGLFTKKK
jgi:hypothetical protein